MNLVLKVSQSPSTRSCKWLCLENGHFELSYSGFTPFLELRLYLPMSVVLSVTNQGELCFLNLLIALFERVLSKKQLSNWIIYSFNCCTANSLTINIY